MEAKQTIEVGVYYRSNEDPSLWVQVVCATSIEVGYTVAPEAPVIQTWRSDFVRRFTKID